MLTVNWIKPGSNWVAVDASLEDSRAAGRLLYEVSLELHDRQRLTAETGVVIEDCWATHVTYRAWDFLFFQWRRHTGRDALCITITRPSAGGVVFFEVVGRSGDRGYSPKTRVLTWIGPLPDVGAEFTAVFIVGRNLSEAKRVTVRANARRALK